jgi:hypothetical protein
MRLWKSCNTASMIETSRIVIGLHKRRLVSALPSLKWRYHKLKDVEVMMDIVAQFEVADEAAAYREHFCSAPITPTACDSLPYVRLTREQMRGVLHDSRQ